jgi:hypothetical protein
MAIVKVVEEEQKHKEAEEPSKLSLAKPEKSSKKTCRTFNRKKAS